MMTAKENKKRERPSDVVEVSGVLDVMSDGFGFLRFENYCTKIMQFSTI